MALITRVEVQERRPERLNVYLDGRLAFSVHIDVARRFGLAEGVAVADTVLRELEAAEQHRELVEAGMALLKQRDHSRAEVSARLMKRRGAPAAVDAALDELTRLGYVDDARYADHKARHLREERKLDRRRAEVELLQNGLKHEVVLRALDAHYGGDDPLAAARELVNEAAMKLVGVPPLTARRRLASLLARRGYEYEAVRGLIDDVLGPESGGD